MGIPKPGTSGMTIDSPAVHETPPSLSAPAEVIPAVRSEVIHLDAHLDQRKVATTDKYHTSAVSIKDTADRA